MIKKTKLKEKAIRLRKKGTTYGGILDKVPVAKSTLALWFKEVKLSTPQFQKLTKNKLAASIRGGIAKKKQRIKRSQEIMGKEEKEIGAISDREMWLIGTTLYWAEGSKEKEWAPGSRTSFTNMDKSMIEVFLKWLCLCGIKKSDLSFGLYIHDNHKARVEEIKKYWAKVTSFPISKFIHIYFKRNKTNTKRRNVGLNYFGIIKITVRQSSTFLRKITGWTSGIYKGINK